jgi:hypothetical protein
MKRLFLLTAMVSATLFAGAQIQFGAKAGLNLSTLHVSPSETGTSFKIAPNVNAGVLVYVPLTSEFGLQPEIVYSGQGTKISSTDDGSGHYNLGYINVPVLLKYKTASGFFAELGPQIGFLATAKAKSEGVSVDVKSSFKSTDFSGVIGIGYLSALNLGVDARYSLGFSNIVKTTPSDNSSAKNGVIQIGVFYMFGKSNK